MHCGLMHWNQALYAMKFTPRISTVRNISYQRKTVAGAWSPGNRRVVAPTPGGGASAFGGYLPGQSGPPGPYPRPFPGPCPFPQKPFLSAFSFCSGVRQRVDLVHGAGPGHDQVDVRFLLFGRQLPDSRLVERSLVAAISRSCSRASQIFLRSGAFFFHSASRMSGSSSSAPRSGRGRWAMRPKCCPDPSPFLCPSPFLYRLRGPRARRPCRPGRAPSRERRPACRRTPCRRRRRCRRGAW